MNRRVRIVLYLAVTVSAILGAPRYGSTLVGFVCSPLTINLNRPSETLWLLSSVALSVATAAVLTLRLIFSNKGFPAPARAAQVAAVVFTYISCGLLARLVIRTLLLAPTNLGFQFHLSTATAGIAAIAPVMAAIATGAILNLQPSAGDPRG